MVIARHWELRWSGPKCTDVFFFARLILILIGHFFFITWVIFRSVMTSFAYNNNNANHNANNNANHNNNHNHHNNFGILGTPTIIIALLVQKL